MTSAAAVTTLTSADIMLLVGILINFIAIMAFPMRLENRLTALETKQEMMYEQFQAQLKRREDYEKGT